MPIMDDILDHEVLGREYKRGQHDQRIATLRRQLEKRFGPLSEASERRLSAASDSELEEIALRFVDAKSIEDALA